MPQVRTESSKVAKSYCYEIVLNLLKIMDIKAVPFKCYTPSICGVDVGWLSVFCPQGQRKGIFVSSEALQLPL